MTAALLEMHGIHKSFGPTTALAGVDLLVAPGQVHVLAGENGAGKSTLVKVLTGVVAPDAGHVTFRGQPFAPAGPQEALRAGVAMIYQEFNLAPHLPVHANVFLGHQIARFGIVRADRQRQICRHIFARLGAVIDPDALVSDLGVASRQLVEIARALSLDARLIVMDEPTAALSEHEAEQLFAVIRSLRDDGVGVIYISHHLEEFGRIGDAYTVLRDGRRVGHGRMAEVTAEQIIRMMVGRDIDQLYPPRRHDIGEPVLTIGNLRGQKGLTVPRIEVRAGEIVGIAGLVGAGRTETLRAVFGLDDAKMDELAVCGAAVLPPSPHRMIRHRLGLLSEDRAAEGLAQSLSIADNLALAVPRKVSRLGVLSLRRRRELARTLIAAVNVKAHSPDQRIDQLSGGNQQKVALARLLGADCRVLLLDEPTRGIDIGAKADIYRLIESLAREGKGIVIVSSYLPELMGLCDSLYVMARGRLSRKFPIDRIDPDRVMALAIGLADAADCQPLTEPDRPAAPAPSPSDPLA